MFSRWFAKPKPEQPRKILFLDDDSARAVIFLTQEPSAVWVQTVPECLAKLEETWDEVHLDHDLNGEQFVDMERDDCGMAVVRWLIAEPRAHLKPTQFIVHSHNQSAATVMGFQISMSGYKAKIRPFGMPEMLLDPGEPLPPDTFLGRLIFRLKGWFIRRPETEDYGYISFHREEPILPDAPPVERLDFSWMHEPLTEAPTGPEPVPPNDR